MKNEDTTRVERLEQLIQTKAFHALSEAEKKFVLEEFELEEQYETMRKLTPLLGEMALSNEGMLPRPSTLESLKHSFEVKIPSDSVWSKLFGWRVPAYATALAIGISCVITWSLTDKRVIEIAEKPLFIRTDTLYLTSKPDTIFKEKVVYRYVRSVVEIKSSTQLPSDLASEKNVIPVGVSMKDKEELEKLLVSGSR